MTLSGPPWSSLLASPSLALRSARTESRGDRVPRAMTLMTRFSSFLAVNLNQSEDCSPSRMPWAALGMGGMGVAVLALALPGVSATCSMGATVIQWGEGAERPSWMG